MANDKMKLHGKILDLSKGFKLVRQQADNYSLVDLQTLEPFYIFLKSKENLTDFAITVDAKLSKDSEFSPLPLTADVWNEVAILELNKNTELLNSFDIFFACENRAIISNIDDDDTTKSGVWYNGNVWNNGEQWKDGELTEEIPDFETDWDGYSNLSVQNFIKEHLQASGDDEILDGGNINEFLKKKDKGELVAGKKYKVLFYDVVMHEEVPPINDVEFEDAFYIIATALTNNSVDTRVTALPPQDEIEGKTPALYKKHLPEMEINISFFEQDWWLMNSVKMGMTTFTFNPFIMYGEFSPIMEVESSTSIGEFSNPFFSTEKDFAKHIIENWKDVVFEMYDVERAYPCVFALLSTQRYPNLHNFKYSETGGFLFTGDLIDVQISNSNGYSDIESKTLTQISGVEAYIGPLRIQNSNIIQSYIIECTSTKFINCNISQIEMRRVKNATFVNYREVLGLFPIDTMQVYGTYLENNQNGEVIGLAGDSDFKGYIVLKSDMSDLEHIQTYWDGSNLTQTPEQIQ